MAIKVYAPRISVKLIKLVDRQAGKAKRYNGSRREWDLTPMLGDHGAVRTVKSLREPAGGFSIVLPDQPDREIQDSLYALVEPMDLIEIRMGSGSGALPIIMRGFVQRIARNEAINDNGGPERSVIISGHDYGAVFRWINVVWNREYMKASAGGENPYLTEFKFQELTGLDVKTYPAADFMSQLLERVVNGAFLKGIETLGGAGGASGSGAPSVPMRIEIDTAQVTEGMVSPYMCSGHEGDLWSLIQLAGDLGWNEFFVYDDDKEVRAMYRPMPYKDATTGGFIMPGVTDPGTIEVDAIDVRGLELAHSCERVANWYEVHAPNATLFNPDIIQLEMLRAGEGGFGLKPSESENSDVRLYGVRKTEATTYQLSGDFAKYPLPGLPLPLRQLIRDMGADWWERRWGELVAMNKDNSVFEEGSLTLRGNAAARIGKYLKLTRGALTAEYYIAGVEHSFIPSADWSTTVQVERGTGFLNRIGKAGPPAWLEGRPGAY